MLRLGVLLLAVHLAVVSSAAASANCSAYSVQENDDYWYGQLRLFFVGVAQIL